MHMASWSDSWLNGVNDWAQIVGILSILLALVSALVVYFTSKETTRRAAEREKIRVITPDQRQSFLKLVENRTKGPIRVLSIATSNEVKDYVNQIRSLLTEAGYGLPPGSPVRIVMGDVSISNFPEGTAMLVCSSRKNAPAYAGQVQKAFESIGIPMPGIEVTTEQNVVLEGEVVIFVSERYKGGN